MPWVIAGLILIAGANLYAAGRAAVDDVNWDPVWLGGEGPWGVKIYKRSSGPDRGWRLEIYYDALFCYEKEWTGRTMYRYMKLELVQKRAEQWIAEHPNGGPCHR